MKVRREKLNEKGLSKLVGMVAIVTIASCGDNVGLFVPYFVTLKTIELITTLIIFIILILVLVFSAQLLSKTPGIGEVIERFNRWIMAVIYIGLGLFIIIENETIQTIYNIIIN